MTEKQPGAPLKLGAHTAERGVYGRRAPWGPVPLVLPVLALIAVALVGVAGCSRAGDSAPLFPLPFGSAAESGPGEPAPPFKVTGLEGEPITDADLRAGGKPYILYFYATW
ncbi:MAG: hypothetical protein GEU73_11315 [Chloroflexi bacterium]|nr:hypothetical protein [Chloroflexota bacterium]